MLSFLETGNVLFSRVVSNQVPSAMRGLTSVFGMRTGDPSLYSHRNGDISSWLSSLYIFDFQSVSKDTLTTAYKDLTKLLRSCCSDQALDLLVSVSLMHYCTYTPDLSTLWSSRGLTILWYGISNLKVGFTLRCLQRLSNPHIATQLCHWCDNWCTIGVSIPVLSY